MTLRTPKHIVAKNSAFAANHPELLAEKKEISKLYKFFGEPQTAEYIKRATALNEKMAALGFESIGCSLV